MFHSRKGVMELDQEEAAFLASLGKKKKKPKPKKPKQPENTIEELYPYQTLVRRLYDEINYTTVKINLPQPQVTRLGSKKTAFSNFGKVCHAMNRSPEHVLSFLKAELSVDISINGDQCLILEGKFTDRQITDVIKKYHTQYVACHLCHAITDLEKDNELRGFVRLTCQKCTATRNVAPIQTGFKAVVTKRKKKI